MLIRRAPRSAPAEILPFLLSDVATGLIGDEARRRLAVILARLPPVLCYGLELRLAGNRNTVDVSQHLRDRAEWMALLAQPDGGDPSWKRLHGLLERRLDPASPEAASIRSIWVELDADDCEGSLKPNVFATLADPLGGASEEHAATLLRWLAPETGTQRIAALRHIATTALAAGARCSHLGLMLARPDAPLRVNVHGLARERILPFLRATGWRGSAEPVCEVLDWSQPLDLIPVPAIDVAQTGLLPRLGLELFPRQQSDSDTVWPQALAVLLQRGLCCPDKAEALLRWPRLLGPEVNGTHWPDWLMLENLLEQPAALGVIHRSIHHLKLQIQGDGQPLAKAYLGARLHWLPEMTA